MSDPNMTDIQPTNGELMRAILELRDGQIRLGTKLEGVDGQMDRLGSDVRVHMASDDLKFQAVADRMNRHDQFHQDERHEEELREQGRREAQEEKDSRVSARAQIVTAIVGILALVAGLVVGIVR